jgi:hypothetical protein
MSLDEFSRTARAAWRRFEPVHAVTYFAPEPRLAYERAGLRGFWRGYFAGRAAPLGPVGAGPVVATFFGFAPDMVRRALPDVWSRATPARTLEARLEGAHEALGGLLAGIEPERIARAAALARRAAESVTVTGRPLGAANLDLDWPEEPLLELWHAVTVLREHRGDGHVAALTVAGVDGCESLVWRCARFGGREALRPNRGWSDDEWAAAAERLAARGFVDDEGVATPAGLAAHEEVEEQTDRLAAGPWRALGPARAAELIELLEPLAAAAATVMPEANPIGL